MNIVNAGARYLVYGEEVKTYKKLPNASYDVDFNPMTGFSLRIREDLEIKEEKIYGTHERRVKKVLDAFARTDRNLGLILSGEKGIGKSLFARLLANEASKVGLPLINVDRAFDGLPSFLASIQQEVVVLFDEFEKNFAMGHDSERQGCSQQEFLSLFDGTDNGKKLFVITCNSTFKLNDYFLNRPGRFHYHFILGVPTPEEITEYMMDKLSPELYAVIPEVVSLSFLSEITYDCLRAISFELNRGYSLKETLEDLNISRVEDFSYHVTILYDDKSKAEGFGCSIKFGSRSRENFRLSYGGVWGLVCLHFFPADLVFNKELRALEIPVEKAKIFIDARDVEDVIRTQLEKATPVRIIFEKEAFITSKLTV